MGALTGYQVGRRFFLNWLSRILTKTELGWPGTEPKTRYLWALVENRAPRSLTWLVKE